jgi:hypothetical protein
MLQRAVRLAAWPVLIALFITPVRFGLELAGVPTVFVFPIGLLWLALGFAVFLGIRLSDEEHPYRLLLLSLVIFSPPSRFPVFVLWWITKTWGLGTHYDIFDSWDQALIGQLFYGSLIQIIPGFLIGSVTLAVRRNRTSFGRL